VRKLCEKFRHYPQPRLILKYKPISIIYNDTLLHQRLLPEKIEPMSEFEKPYEIPLPKSITLEEDGDKETVYLVNDKYPQGRIILYTSSEPLSRNTRLGDLNRIDIVGEIGVIASYKIPEIGYVQHLSLPNLFMENVIANT